MSIEATLISAWDLLRRRPVLLPEREAAHGSAERRTEQLGDRHRFAVPGRVAGRALHRAELSELRQFCAGLSLCQRGHSFRRDDADWVVWYFADPEHAARFQRCSGGELMDPASRPKRPR